MDVETVPEVDAREQRLHVGQRVDGDAGPTHLALGQRVVGVAPEQRRHVEGGREPVAAGAQQLLEAPVGVLGRAEAGELAHRPEPGAVHGGVGTPRVGVLAGQLGARRGRTRARAARPTSSRSAPPASANGRTASCQVLPVGHGPILLQRQSNVQPRSRRSPRQPAGAPPAGRRGGGRVAAGTPMSVKTCSFMASVATVRRAPARGGQAQPGCPGRRRDWTAGVTRPSASSRSTALVTLAALTCRRSPILPRGSAPSSGERQQHQDLVAGEREPERPQDGVGPGQEDLLQPHDGGDDRHARRLRPTTRGTPIVAPPRRSGSKLSRRGSATAAR